jgi:basic membrane protein A
MSKRYVSLTALLLVLALLFTACASTTAEPEAEEPAAEESQTEEPAAVEEDKPSVALIMGGPINDRGWNTAAYDGLMAIEEEYGVDVSYAETVSKSDVADVFRNYATLGYDLVIGHTSEFSDAALAVAKDFPDTQFMVTNADIQAENVTSVQIADIEQGFLLGAFSALITETGTVGVIGGVAIPPIKNLVDGFTAGAKYVNPDVVVKSAFTGSFEDLVKTKETALSFAEAGADVVTCSASQAGLGSIDGCEEAGIYALGVNSDQYEVAPDTVVVSCIKSVPQLFLFTYDKLLSNEMGDQIYRLGAKDGAVFLSEFHHHTEWIPEDVMEELDAILAGLASGEISI